MRDLCNDCEGVSDESRHRGSDEDVRRSKEYPQKMSRVLDRSIEAVDGEKTRWGVKVPIYVAPEPLRLGDERFRRRVVSTGHM